MGKKRKKKKNSNSNFKIKLIVFLFIILMIFLVYTKYKNEHDEALLVSAKTSALFENINPNTNVNITKYIVYGTHLNIEGTVSIPKISGINLDKAEIIIKNAVCAAYTEILSPENIFIKPNSFSGISFRICRIYYAS